ncbi:MAG: esterase/lipase family protein [Nocardioides sp.]
MLRRLLLVLVVLLACEHAVPSAYAHGGGYAPLNRTGPSLSVNRATLRAAMTCHGDPHAAPEPVLLNPATSVTPAENYSWNYEKAFTRQGRYWCAVTMPHHTFGDIQTAAEYLVFAIRRMHATTGRRIAILGHSQGGMSMRWALRFWPATRAMVDDVIGMAGDNHGTTMLVGCVPHVTTCTPAVWQQLRGSAFMRALNSRTETFAGISYTEIYTHTDEVVTPSTGDDPSSALHTGLGRISNVATQSICPLEVYEHLMTGTVSPTTYALVMDALDHPGPAVPARIARTVCGRLYMPGIDPLDVTSFLPLMSALPSLASTELPLVTLSGAPMLSAEPPLRCYVFKKGC